MAGLAVVCVPGLAALHGRTCPCPQAACPPGIPEPVSRIGDTLKQHRAGISGFYLL